MSYRNRPDSIDDRRWPKSYPGHCFSQQLSEAKPHVPLVYHRKSQEGLWNVNSISQLQLRKATGHDRYYIEWKMFLAHVQQKVDCVVGFAWGTWWYPCFPSRVKWGRMKGKTDRCLLQVREVCWGVWVDATLRLRDRIAEIMTGLLSTWRKNQKNPRTLRISARALSSCSMANLRTLRHTGLSLRLPRHMSCRYSLVPLYSWNNAVLTANPPPAT